MSAMSILPVFATPLGELALPGALALNPALEALLGARAAVDRNVARDAFCYRSAENLYEWPDAPVAQLRDAVIGGVYEFVAELNDFSAQELESFRLAARASYTIVRPDGCAAVTQHPLTAWCAVYCVAAPPPAPERPDSGVLRLYEARLGTMFPDATSALMRLPYRTGHYGWRPQPGSMVVFPASLPYEVATVRSTGRLIFVTTRVRFVAPGQSGVGRW